MVKFELDATWARDLAYHWLGALFFFYILGLSPPIALWLRQSFYSYCDEPDCHVIVKELHRSLDMRTNPCDNFYRYQIFDDSCELKALVSLLAELKITWPFSKEQSTTLGNVSAITALTKLRMRHGIDLLYAGGVSAASVKLGRQLVLRVGSLLPHPQPVLNGTQLSSGVANLARMMGSASVNYAFLAQMVQSQEEKLATFMNHTKLERDEDTLLTFDKANYIFSGYNWTLFKEVVTAELGYGLAAKDYISVSSRTFKAVTGALEDGVAMHAFLGWRLVRELAPMACSQAGLALAQAAGGDVDLLSDSLTTSAMNRLQEHMPMAVAAPYIHQQQPGHSREDLQRNVGHLVQSLREGLSSSSYLTASFRKTTARLMRKLKSHVLYPDFTHLDVQVDRLY
ncbi:hypothetical protein V5799_012898, partial [Amblyomma americanum]